MKQLIVLLLSPLLFLSCSGEQIISPIQFPIDGRSVGVKSIILYASLESNQILSIEDYEYNRKGLLSKKSYYGGDREMLSSYELFNYENGARLLYKFDYHNNINSPTGFILLGTTAYFYSNNLLVEEKIFYPYGRSYDKYDYEYDGNYLIKKTKYHNEELESVTTYDYKGGRLEKETLYDKPGNIIYIDEYVYKENFLTEIFRNSSNGELLTKTSYSYNTWGKISLENLQVIAMYLSIQSHVKKYEY